jgi:ABC-type multidrug transport system fused ATPase/permease subunit
MSAPSSATAWREARRLFNRHRGPLAGALLLVAINRLAALALPAATRLVVDDVVGRGRTSLLIPIALFVCLAIAIESAAALGAAQAAGAAGQKAVAALRRELETRTIRLPLRDVDDLRSGALAARVMTDPEQIRYLVGSGLVQFVASLLTAILALGLLVWLEPMLTLAVLVVVGASAGCMTGAFRRIASALEGVLQQHSELTAALTQTLSGLRIVKAYAAEREEAHRFARESHRLLRRNIDALRHIAALNAGGTLASGSLGVLLLVGGACSVTAGRMSIGSCVMYVWLALWLLGPVLHLTAGAGELGRAAAALRRIAELRQRLTEEEEDRERRRVGRVAGRVDFERVSFAYQPNRSVLSNITLHCPVGSITALIGPNGSGKSTLCRLILAYDRPIAGRILVDGDDLALLHRKSYRSNIGIVLQDDLLFDGTIADCIRYGRPRASLAEVEAAGRLAHCDEFVARLPDGYSTRVGERGAHLSAGQRQRVAIARAFLVDPRILVLDEATSSLDAESEGLIQDALSFLCRGRTTFIIAHRLATVRNADQIVVLDHGFVVERGTHEELLALRGRYSQLYAGQPHGLSDCLADVIDRLPAWLPVGIAERQTQRRSVARAGDCRPGSGTESARNAEGTDGY